MMIFLFLDLRIIKQIQSQIITIPSMEPSSKSDLQQHYVLSKYRYVNLFIFILAAAVNGFPSQAFASINSLVERQYHYSSVVVTLNVLLSSIVHPFFATPTNLILDKFGVRIGVTIGGILVILGVWTRTLIQVDQPQWSLIGSTLAGIGNLFLISSPSVFALRWFSNEQTPKIIAATVLVNLVSSGFGASLAGFMLPSNANPDQIRRFFQLQAIIVTVPFIIFFIFYRQKPKHPPSRAAAAAKQVKQKQPYIKTLKQLAKNKSYLKVVLSMSFSYGIFLSFVSILDSSLDTLGYSNPGRATSTTLGSAMLMGILSAFLFSYAVRTTLKFKYIISLSLLGAVVTFALLNIMFVLKVQSYPIIGVMAACAGFFVIPLTALFTTYSAQLTFPVAQGSATGFLFAGSQAIGFISGLLWAAFLQKQDKWRVYIIFGVHSTLIALSLLINLVTQQHLNKTNYEKGFIKSIQNIEAQQKLADSLLQSQTTQNMRNQNNNQ